MRGTSRVLAILIALGAMSATGASAKILAPWGSNLAGTPTLDTANGASRANHEHSTEHTVYPDPHDGADFTLWNVNLPGAEAHAPSGGQIRAIRVKGCAVEDHSAPSQLSAGTPVNLIDFQSLVSQRDGSSKSIATAPDFTLPFCSDSRHPASGRISTSTVTTFHPIHMCVARGGTVSFYDIGGFVPNPNGQGWYPEGVPFDVIARVEGASMDSFADADLANGTYAAGSSPRGSGSGWGREHGEELMLQVSEGIGPDAYGLCPGGTANEPGDSNAVVCVAHPPYGGHRRCGRTADADRRTLSALDGPGYR